MPRLQNLHCFNITLDASSETLYTGLAKCLLWFSNEDVHRWNFNQTLHALTSVDSLRALDSQFSGISVAELVTPISITVLPQLEFLELCFVETPPTFGHFVQLFSQASHPQVVVSSATKYTIANCEEFPSIVTLSLERVPFGSGGPTLAVEDTVSWREVTLKNCDFSAGSYDCIQRVVDAIRRGKGWPEFHKLNITNCHGLLPSRLEQLKLEFGEKLELVNSSNITHEPFIDGTPTQQHYTLQLRSIP
ncbi:hypothetical protein BD410DRAFT_798563 [Rickenella mellea]|uniref:RNI-like protein n=1 Tax=Rickenella mellea TaxID=50990 RepID=A0A4R5XG95_9AGAM|nr:hypothetical protein BD410DRAFT_798563 [Rickenella mellea]